MYRAPTEAKREGKKEGRAKGLRVKVRPSSEAKKRAEGAHPASGAVGVASLLLGIGSWRCKVRATRAPTLAELFALLGRHPLPALVPSLPNTLIDSPPNI